MEEDFSRDDTRRNQKKFSGFKTKITIFIGHTTPNTKLKNKLK